MIRFNKDISYFARTNFRNENKTFGIYQQDRMVGMHIIGKTGTGKTNLVETLLFQDIYAGRGACIIDVAGDLTNHIIPKIPEFRRKDVVVLNLQDSNFQFGYNPLRHVKFEHRHLVVSHILEVFERLWGGNAWGVRIEYILRNSLLALLDQPNSTFADIPKILTDEQFRNSCIDNIIQPEVRNFWLNEYSKFSKSDPLPVLNKVGSFLTIPIIKRILVENKEQISFSNILNDQKILIVSIPKGTVGKDAAHLFGSLIIGTIASAGFNRAMIPEIERKPFVIYLDEFQNFTSVSLVEMFAELRKFKIGFVLAHQYLNQLNDKIRDALLGNIGTTITFRLSYQDAKFYAKEMYPIFEVDDFINLANHHIYIKLLIDGIPSTPFSAVTIPVSELLPKDIPINKLNID